MLKDDNPDKGTETRGLLELLEDTAVLLKDDNPDKGTETEL